MKQQEILNQIMSRLDEIKKEQDELPTGGDFLVVIFVDGEEIEIRTKNANTSFPGRACLSFGKTFDLSFENMVMKIRNQLGDF